MKTILTLSILLASSISLASSSNEVDTFKLRKFNKVGELIYLLKDMSEKQLFGLYGSKLKLSQSFKESKKEPELILATLKNNEYLEAEAITEKIASDHLGIKLTDRKDLIIGDFLGCKAKAYISTSGDPRKGDYYYSYVLFGNMLYILTDAKILQILYSIQSSK